MTSDTITRQLKALRERAGLSVRGLAEKLDMSPSGYSHYETPTRFKDAYLPMAIALRLADTLKPHGINPAEVLALAAPTPPANEPPEEAMFPGFAEDHALPWRGNDADGLAEADICRVLAPKAGNPGPYEVHQDLPALGLFVGDIIIIDRRRLPGPGDIALGNARTEDGKMKTVIGRYFPPYFITSETMMTGKALIAGDDSLALYHPVVASFRRISSC